MCLHQHGLCRGDVTRQAGEVLVNMLQSPLARDTWCKAALVLTQWPDGQVAALGNLTCRAMEPIVSVLKQPRPAQGDEVRWAAIRLLKELVYHNPENWRGEQALQLAAVLVVRLLPAHASEWDGAGHWWIAVTSALEALMNCNRPLHEVPISQEFHSSLNIKTYTTKPAQVLLRESGLDLNAYLVNIDGVVKIADGIKADFKACCKDVCIRICTIDPAWCLTGKARTKRGAYCPFAFDLQALFERYCIRNC